MQTITSKEHSAMAKKTSDSQIKASSNYHKGHIKRVALDLNTTTMTDVLDHLESVNSKQGYIISLIRSDMYRKFSNHLVINGKDIESETCMQYADLIEEHFDRIRELSNPEAFSSARSMFTDDAPAWVIVAEYLRSTETDPIIIT